MAILVLNCGSSSVKSTLFGEGGEVLRHGLQERVEDYRQALLRVLAEAGEALPGGLARLAGVGHRVVHGGPEFTRSARVDARVMEGLRRAMRFAPLHNPHNIRGIAFAAERLPRVPQVAVFDTAFHLTIPPQAHTYALPGDLCREFGLRRYGFHGISHRYVHDRALALCGRKSSRGFRAVTCHLGNGCSAAAVRDGACRDTSMGFTPLEGLVMGTRCGDLDPALVLFLLEKEGPRLSRSRASHLLQSESGLLGVSGLSADVRDLLAAARRGHPGAELALSVFCYRLRKYIGAYAAALGGVDALVFTAGIGEHSPEVRERTLAGMEELGFALDRRANRRAKGEGEAEIGAGRTRIFVIPTDEDRMIRDEVAGVLGKMPGRKR